jgi:hypothetical protein
MPLFRWYLFSFILIRRHAIAAITLFHYCHWLFFILAPWWHAIAICRHAMPFSLFHYFIIRLQLIFFVFHYLLHTFIIWLRHIIYAIFAMMPLMPYIFADLPPAIIYAMPLTPLLLRLLLFHRDDLLMATLSCHAIATPLLTFHFHYCHY